MAYSSLLTLLVASVSIANLLTFASSICSPASTPSFNVKQSITTKRSTIELARKAAFAVLDQAQGGGFGAAVNPTLTIEQAQEPAVWKLHLSQREAHMESLGASMLVNLLTFTSSIRSPVSTPSCGVEQPTVPPFAATESSSASKPELLMTLQQLDPDDVVASAVGGLTEELGVSLGVGTETLVEALNGEGQ